MSHMPSLALLDPGGCPCGEEPGYCACNPEERVLRCVMRGVNEVPALEAQQREECLKEIGAVEGYDRADYETVPDATLAKGVLDEICL